jgi:hypothetical protein
LCALVNGAHMQTKQDPGVIVTAQTEWTDHRGALALFGLRRSYLFHLAKTGAIKSVSLKERGEERGKRLYHVPSVRSFINSKLRTGSE